MWHAHQATRKWFTPLPPTQDAGFEVLLADGTGTVPAIFPSEDAGCAFLLHPPPGLAVTYAWMGTVIPGRRPRLIQSLDLMKLTTETAKTDRYILRDRVLVSLAFPQENGDPDVHATA